MVLVDVEVAAREQLEIEAGVERQQREQVVEEPDARRELVRPSRRGRATTRSAVSVLVRATYAVRPSAGAAAGPERREEDVVLDEACRSVIRMPPLTTRTTRPCSSSVAPSGSSERRKTKLPWPSGQS